MKLRYTVVIVLGAVIALVSCRNEPESPKARITKLTFDELSTNVYVGETVTVGIKVEPANAKNSEAIVYAATESGIVDIKAGSSNDGVVIEGLKRGSTVITARANGTVDYCMVNVLGGGEHVIPYIVVPNTVLECGISERRSIVASLVGGTPVDENDFSWAYTNHKTINLETTKNVGVFDTVGLGESVITVSHPKAQFSVNILVFVAGVDESPVYITTESNVINLVQGDKGRQYEVQLKGGTADDYYGFKHEILNGKDVIDLKTNNHMGMIDALQPGIARIGISHASAAYRLEIVVIVREEIAYRYIDVDKTLVVMQEGEFETLNAVMVGQDSSDVLDTYRCEVEDNAVIRVMQTNCQFVIEGLTRGKSLLTIHNDYADFSRTILVIVNGQGSVYDNEVYISTNQNVITMEAGGDDAVLTMTLVGGNEADKNNFVWTVDDGSIISVESAYGQVTYKNRAITSNIGDTYTVQAVITAKKVGTATITLENRKANNSLSVMVKVYKKGVFGVIPAVVSGPGVFLVGTGQEVEARLSVIAGNERSISHIVWSSDNTDVVTVSNVGLTGLLKGKGKGIATITVTATDLKYNYTAVVVVDEEPRLTSASYMYVDNPFISLIKGNSLSFNVIGKNITPAQKAAIQVVNNNVDSIEVLAFQNSITVTALELGEGEIIVSSPGLNTIVIRVMVEEYELNPDMPFYLRSAKSIYGLVKNTNIEIEVDLVGGSAANEQSIIWGVHNSGIVSINGNGKKCLVAGLKAGQTVITAHHPKSHNSLEIVVYTVETEAELQSTIIIYAKESNILLRRGEARYISVVTNASNAQKNSFQWNVGNLNVVNVNVSPDKVKAYVEGLSVGSTTITVGYGSQFIPVVMYIAVVDSAAVSSSINVPSILEMVAGDSVYVNAVTGSIVDRYNIEWDIKESSNKNIISIYGNGDSCLVQAVTAGAAAIRVRHTSSGFVKDIMVYVYGSVDSMVNSYVMAGEQSRYVINKGDIISVGLVFGMKGFPEHELPNIMWRTLDNAVMTITGNGRTAIIEGRNAGVGKITIESAIALPCEIEVEVRDNVQGTGQYWLSIDPGDKVKGIVAGEYADITVRVFSGNNEVFNAGGMSFTVENPGIIAVEQNANTIRVRALAGTEGQSYIYVNHSMAEQARILIYTAVTSYALEMMYPIYVEKSHYLLHKGDQVTVRIETINDDSTKLRNIAYGFERGSGALSLSERSKKEVTVTAINAGSDVVCVYYNAEVVQKIYFSVVEAAYTATNDYITTESMISLVVGGERETFVDSNIQYGFAWKTQDTGNAIDMVSTGEKSAMVRGVSPGSAVIAVSAHGLERYIVVNVSATKEEAQRLEAINIEQRRFRIVKNESVTVTIQSYQGKVEGTTVYSDYDNHDVEFGNVIEFNYASNDTLSVKGINEGVAAIQVTNSYYGAEFIVYIEVYAVEQGSVNQGNGSGGGSGDRMCYITAPKTLYVIGMDDANVPVNVQTIGGAFYGCAFWVWGGYDTDIIDVVYQGSSAVVNPRKNGQTVITVSNRYCKNQLQITVIVGKRFEFEDSLLPYIYVEKAVYEAYRGDTAISIPYSMVNVGNFNIADLRYQVYSAAIAVTHDAANSRFVVNALDTGIGRFVISYGDLQQEVYVLVKEPTSFSNVYLTTSENFVIVAVNELRTVNIQLMGYEDLNSSNFVWAAASGQGVMQLSGNGQQGYIYGVSASTNDVVVSVTHPQAAYPLNIYVKVVADATKQHLMYLTTQRNIVETVVGASNEPLYIQKIGDSVDKCPVTWAVSDSTIASVVDNGYYAQFAAKKEGVARVSITMNHAQNCQYRHNTHALEIIIVVRNPTHYYIRSSESLIIMKPANTQKRISVWLENGNEQDNSGFSWSVTSVPSDPNKPTAAVVHIVGSREECFINPLNEGTATITVAHGKALAYSITVYVTHYEKIAFSASNKEIVVGESEFVGINLPTYEYLDGQVTVWPELINGDSGSAFCEVLYTRELVLLRGIQAGPVLIKARLANKPEIAELLVNVVDAFNPNLNRIITAKSLYVLSMKSGPLRIDAQISGPQIFEQDFDNIVWKAEKSDIISMIPLANPADKDTAKGRQIQITPLKVGTVNITISHEDLDSVHTKTIQIIIDELNQKFRMLQGDMEMNSLAPEQAAVEIVGGTSRDYNEVVWTAMKQQKWDGTTLEIVRIMGSGKEVTLYPMNDGVTTVFASYGDQVCTFEVRVISDYYFSFQTGTVYMWPGTSRDIPFDVRPAGTMINWINVGAVDEEPVVVYGEVMGSSIGESELSTTRYMRVTAKREGTTTITGIANGKISTVNIVVQYDYQFRLNDHLDLIDGKQNFVPRYEGNGIKSDGIQILGYTVYPPDTYIKVISTSLPAGLTVTIEPPVEIKNDYNEYIGKGRIIFTGTRELETNVKFRLYKARPSGSGEEVPAQTKADPPQYLDQEYRGLLYKFDNNEIVPYFVRGDGVFSNPNQNTKQLFNGKFAYGGETLKTEAGNNTYSLVIGDGEEHYLLLDKKIDIADVDIKEVRAYSSATNDVSQKITAGKVELDVNGVKTSAIKLSGKEDIIEYTRVALSKDLYLTTNGDAGNNASIKKVMTNLYSYRFTLTYAIPVKRYVGSWMSISQSPYTNGGGGNTYDSYYLIKDSYLDSLTAAQKDIVLNVFKVQYIASIPTVDPFLSRYTNGVANSLLYTYCLTGKETVPAGNAAFYQQVLNACRDNYTYADLEYGNVVTTNEPYRAYRPAFRYSYVFYIGNESFFSTGTNTSGLVYDGEGNVIGGTFLSWNMLDGGLVDSYVEKQLVIYEYDPEFLILLDVVFPAHFPFSVDLDEVTRTNYIKGWDKGFFRDEYGQSFDSYNADLLYSSVAYAMELYDAEFSGSKRVQKLDVLRGKFVENDYVTVMQDSSQWGIYIYGSSFVDSYCPAAFANYYKSSLDIRAYGCKDCRDWTEDVVYFDVINMARAPLYKYGSVWEVDGWGSIPIDGSPDIRSADGTGQLWDKKPVLGYSTLYSISAIARTGTRSTTVTSPSGLVQIPTTYTYYINVPGNRLGGNIFAESGGNVQYGAYGPLYKAGHYLYKNNGFYLNGNHKNSSHEPEGIAYGTDKNASEIGVQFMLEWKDNGRDIIVPYYILNRFPYKYVQPECHTTVVSCWGNYNHNPNHAHRTSYESKQLVKLDDQGSGAKPMPTLDKSIIAAEREEGTITITYDTFTEKNKTITIKYDYQPRRCHMMHKGSITDDRYINTNPHADAYVEQEGPVNEFFENGKIRPELAKYLEYLN